MTSLEWFNENYQGFFGVPVSIHENEKADNSIAVERVKVLTLNALSNLVLNIKGFLYEICREDLSESELISTIESSLISYKLTYSDLTRIYLTKFIKSR